MRLLFPTNEMTLWLLSISFSSPLNAVLDSGTGACSTSVREDVWHALSVSAATMRKGVTKVRIDGGEMNKKAWSVFCSVNAGYKEGIKTSLYFQPAYFVLALYNLRCTLVHL